MIRNVVLEVLASNQKNRLPAQASSGKPGQEVSQGPLVLQGEAELAYLTHEGLFISDALNEAQQKQEARLVGQDQTSTVNFRTQTCLVETADSTPPSGVTEGSASREQSFL